MNWAAAPLENLTDRDRPITYGVVKPGYEDAQNGVLFVRGGDIFDGRIAIDKLRTITTTVSAQYRRTLLRGGELLASLVGNPGAVAIVPPSLAGANIARQAGLIALNDSVHHKYVEWFLRSPAGQAAMGLYVTGAVQKVINLADLKRVLVPLPPIQTQRRIATILSAYDDLIENNTRRIAIIEEMARRIYEEWFVRFRFPGHEKVRMVESELGLVPEGWIVSTVDNVVEEIIDYRGKTPTKLGDEWASDGILALSALNVKHGRLVNLEKSKFVSEALYEKWMKTPLREMDILMTSEAPLGELYLLLGSQRYCLSQRLFGIRANRKVLTPMLLYLCLGSENTQSDIASRATGATVGGIRQSELRKVQVLIPPQRLQDAIDPTLTGLLRCVSNIHRKNTNLRTTRDLLLPKLISGELDVSNMPEPEAMAA